jgi:hypothetical protein
MDARSELSASHVSGAALCGLRLPTFNVLLLNLINQLWDLFSPRVMLCQTAGKRSILTTDFRGFLPPHCSLAGSVILLLVDPISRQASSPASSYHSKLVWRRALSSIAIVSASASDKSSDAHLIYWINQGLTSLAAARVRLRLWSRHD